jgi:SAM-dependent methyltransferase
MQPPSTVKGQSELHREYVLGTDAQELARLDRQAAAIDRPTRLLLQSAGLGPGMRVLDLGTGLGHVARIVGELVGPTGCVVGIEQSPEVISLARQRTIASGATHVTFVEGNAATWCAPEPFDVVVGRLLLFHVADPVAVVSHHITNLRRDGLFVAIDFDIGGARTEPPIELVDTVARWVEAAFLGAGAWPRIGAHLGVMLEQAGLTNVTTFGVQAYLSPGNPTGPALFAGVVRSLAPAIVRHGIATAEELDVETLEGRIAEATKMANAVVLPPTVVGACGLTPFHQP